ncbi:MAG: ankyrin repeat domain-containing protein [Proteobacteria bacterium]|nr:ankyrin repeat domain-containing protein [Pseudomonadota bacterium]
MSLRFQPVTVIRAAFLAILLILVSGCVSTLGRAVDSGDIEAAKRAIEKGGSVNGNQWVTSPLNRAISNDDLEMVKLLHQNGATLRRGYFGVAATASALSTYGYLAENGVDIAVCALDQSYPTWWNRSLNIGSFLPPLGSAIARKNIQSTKLLLDLGAPLEYRCDVPLGGDYNFSAIIAASVLGNSEIIGLLIKRGSNPNRLTLSGLTPLSMAAQYGYFDAARVLLANGAYHSYSNQIKQPIEYAIEAGNENIVDLLVYAGAKRPQRTASSNVLGSIANALVDGVILVAGIYLIVEGAKYYNFQDSFTSSSSSSDDRTRRSPSQSIRANDDNQCNSDFQCSVLEVCLKKPGHISGICVKDASQTRLKGERDSVESAFVRPLTFKSTGNCELGFHWDLIYQACVK